MRILFLTPQIPFPPRQGTALRNWGLISGLAGHHEIWLLSFDEQGPSGDAIPTDKLAPELRQACAQVRTFPVPRRTPARRLRTLLTSTLPDMAWRLWSPAFAAQFDRWTSEHNFDIIQIEGIELAHYPLQSSTVRRPSSVVFDDHNCEYLLQRRAFEADLRNPKRWHAAAYSLINWRRLIGFERRMVRAARATLCVSPQDAEAIRRLDPSIQPHVIFNGIHVSRYSDQSSIPSASSGQAVNRQSSIVNSTLVFTGKMDFRWNVDAALWCANQVLPLVRRQAPGARLLIVGQNPSPRLDPLRADPNITLTGAVEDIRPYIQQADVYVAPLLVGSGTRFKLLEAMSMQRAIVTTSQGCEGFDVTSGRELVVADTAADFARAIVELLQDPARREDMGRQARAFVSAHYDWSAIVPQLEAIYQHL